MKLICPISGLTYTTSSGFGSGRATHPFLISSTRASLTHLLPTYLSGDLTADNAASDESYLYCLAWVPLLGVTFSATLTKSLAHPILLANLERLVHTIEKLDNYSRDEFPSFIVTESDTDLSSLPNWLDAINETCIDLSRTKAEWRKDKSLARIESTLSTIINSMRDRDINRAGKVIANWAAVAADFPPAISEYWCEIINFSFREATMDMLHARITLADMDELIEHCEYNIPHGSSYAHTLMSKLRAANSMLKEFIDRPAYRAIGNPEQMKLKPSRNQFSSNIEYIRALIKFTSTVSNSNTVEL